jgi:hypothetical protein
MQGYVCECLRRGFYNLPMRDGSDFSKSATTQPQLIIITILSSDSLLFSRPSFQTATVITTL